MKKSLFIFVFLIILSCVNAFSAGIYENTNQSAEFIRTLNRYASTDVDAAFFNPAGTAFMNDGLYFYLSNQMIFDYQTMKDSSAALAVPQYNYQSKYEGEVMTWAYPSIYAVYKKDNWAGFVNMSLIGRGAAATYGDGLPYINKAIIGYAMGVLQGMGDSLKTINTDSEVKGHGYFVGMTLGGAYRINDTMSAALAVRYVHAEQNKSIKVKITDVQGNATPGAILMASGYFSNVDVSVDSDGDSCGFIGGFDIKPVERMNIGLKYEYYTPMKVKNLSPKRYSGPEGILGRFPDIQKGYEQKMTLPMNGAVGVAYMITPELKVEGSFVYYFNKLADWGKDATGKDIAEMYDNGYDAGISFEYAFMRELKGSIGYSYSVSGINSDVRNAYPLNMQSGLDANTVGLGGTYSFANGIDFTLATMIVFFKDETDKNASNVDKQLSPVFNPGKTKYTDKVYNIAAGVTYKFM